MGLCGWLVAKMLRVPMVCTYHTDFPAYVDKLARDHRVTNGTIAYMKWFYGQAARVFARSRAYRFKISDLGVSEDRIAAITPAVDTTKFNPSRRDEGVWARYNVKEPHRLLYAGRVSVEKNLPLLADAFSILCGKRRDTALIIAGEGPHLAEMKQKLAHLPAYFVGVQDDASLARLYASADLLVFPSRTDTLGQVVMEAQACGLPAVVSNDGGPREIVADDETGVVLDSNSAARWAAALGELLDDPHRRERMRELAAQRASRSTLADTFESFWSAHLTACEEASSEPALTPALKSLAGL
jgi:glycosyltransferase involved in cell wall biosynthesis